MDMDTRVRGQPCPPRGHGRGHGHLKNQDRGHGRGHGHRNFCNISNSTIFDKENSCCFE